MNLSLKFSMNGLIIDQEYILYREWGASQVFTFYWEITFQCPRPKKGASFCFLLKLLESKKLSEDTSPVSSFLLYSPRQLFL